MNLTSCQSEEAGECAENETSVALSAELLTIKRSLEGTNETGICQCCKEPIPAERLEALPKCFYCVTCQALTEGGRRQREEMFYVVAEEDQPEETPPQPTIKLPKSKPLSKDEFSKIFK